MLLSWLQSLVWIHSLFKKALKEGNILSFLLHFCLVSFKCKYWFQNTPQYFYSKTSACKKTQFGNFPICFYCECAYWKSQTGTQQCIASLLHNLGQTHWRYTITLWGLLHCRKALSHRVLCTTANAFLVSGDHSPHCLSGPMFSSVDAYQLQWARVVIAIPKP